MTGSSGCCTRRASPAALRARAARSESCAQTPQPPPPAQKGETIGRGHFAKVKLVRQRSTGEFYAAKILDKQLDEHQEDYASMMREFGRSRTTAPASPTVRGCEPPSGQRRAAAARPHSHTTPPLPLAEVLHSLKHKNIVGLHEAYEVAAPSPLARPLPPALVTTHDRRHPCPTPSCRRPTL